MDFSVPARLERIDDIVIDCAHNPHSLNIALAQIPLLERQDSRPLELVFGVMSDKAVGPMSALIRNTQLPVHLVEPNYPRRLALSALDEYFRGYRVFTRQSVVEFMDTRRPDSQYLVVGSSFLAAEVKSILEGTAYPECGIVTLAR